MNDDARQQESARWSDRSLTELIDHILATHHVYTRAALERATALAAEVARAHGDAHPEALRAIAVFAQVRDELIPHMEREEVVLFPYVRDLDAGRPPRAHFPSVAMPARMMDMQHKVVDTLLATMRAQANDYALPPDASDAWRALWNEFEALEADVDQHVHLESDVLFPRAIAAELAARAAQGRHAER